jgi:hypothetical protein
MAKNHDGCSRLAVQGDNGPRHITAALWRQTNFAVWRETAEEEPTSFASAALYDQKLFGQASSNWDKLAQEYALRNW